MKSSPLWDRLFGSIEAAGLRLALAAGQVLASIVYGSSPRDPLVLAGVLGLMFFLSVFSLWIPARRALRIEPTSALRYE